MDTTLRLRPEETRTTFILASIFSLRMLGLFMILPGFSLFARHLTDATPCLIGLAIGVYGITASLLQIPMGMLSDRLGRKPVIILGLLVFTLGSILAAKSPTLEGIIVGRALQGAGAVSSAILALVADLTREEVRTRAMGMIGIAIGLSFTLAMVLGPILNSLIGIPGIFWIIAWMSVLSIVLVVTTVPTPARTLYHPDQGILGHQLLRTIKRKKLWGFYFGIMALHAMLTANFVVLPIALQDRAGMPVGEHWHLYLPVLLSAFVLSFPLIIFSELKNKVKTIIALSIAALIIAQFLLHTSHHLLPFTAAGLFIFFMAFTTLEACLPSAISKLAPLSSRGTALGIFSTVQFLGAFIGGVIGGTLYQLHDLTSIFVFCMVIGGIWLLLTLVMPSLPHYSSRALHVGRQSVKEAMVLESDLKKVPGVIEVMVVPEAGSAYLKVDANLLNEETLQKKIQH